MSILLLTTYHLLLTTSLIYSQNDELLRNLLWKDFLALEGIRPKIALVLGGGGARGLTHIGVLKALEEKKIPIDIIVGTSIGALVGGLYASGMKIEDLEKMGQGIGWNKISNLSSVKLFTLITAESLLSTEKLEKYLKKYIGAQKFDELKIPFACVACDIKTGERIVFKDGEAAFAMRVSATIPGVFNPVEYRHRLLVDGGIVDNLPVDIAKVMDADFIIAVYPQADISNFEVKNVMTTLSQVINLQGGFLMAKQMKESDFLLIPNVKNVSLIELDRSQECIEAGIVATRNKIDEIKDKILEKFIDKIVFKK
ncbi:MAG: patatin-like phospholipase family protein [Elusimicrobia bacterium]|nr:patatin-like phospholipase family protein [Elusimicrobiota bacterium]